MSSATLRVRPGVLKRIRELHRLPSDAALAHAIGVSRATLDRINRGEVAPSPHFIAGLCLFTGIGIGEAFEVLATPGGRNAA